MENIFIFVADAMMYDLASNYFDKKVIRTLTPGSWTPTSFSSLISARHPTNHNVNSFNQVLDEDITTVYDFFENSTFYDHPDDSLPQKVLQHHVGNPKELDELDEPFLYIERAQETHMPYNSMEHDNELEKDIDGPTSGRGHVRMLERQGKWPKIYGKAVENSIEHFKRHLEKLKEEGFYEDTLIIFTSDHGELLDERSFGIRRVGHGHPMHDVLLDAPTVFYNYEIDADHMRSIDIIPTALSIVGKEEIGDGVDIRKNQNLKGYCQGEGQDKFITKWEMTESGPKCLEPAKLRLYKFIEDYKAMKQRLENKLDLEHSKTEKDVEEKALEEINI